MDWIGCIWAWTTEHAIVLATVVTALATAFIAAFTVSLARATRGMRAIAQRQIEIMEKQTLVVGRQTDIIEKQTGIARVQFFATHRPKLEVRFVRFLPGDDSVPPDQRPVGIEFVIINTGTSEAVVIGSKVAAIWRYAEDIPLPTELSGEDVVPHHRFKVGATDKACVQTDRYGGLNWVMSQGRKKLYLLGWIVYADARGEEFGDTRTTYFGRVFIPETRLFTAATDLVDWEFIH